MNEDESPLSTIVKVNEIFSSFQGEGPHVGRMALFIRMAGCNLDCSWCDTKDARVHGMEITLEALYKSIKEYNIRYVVFTGGEPLRQYVRLKPLLEELKDNNYIIAVETNGTIRIPSDAFDIIVVSPKTQESAKPWIDAIKIRQLTNIYIKPVVTSLTISGWAKLLEEIDPKLVYYMPMGATPDEYFPCMMGIMDYMMSGKIEGNIGLRFHVMVGLK